ncbi:luciferase family oxidoreductase, group 1 [Halobacillus karajensis]|uniref:Limonene 1,2-monooxygenase n=1 Tax=Halobacillus karajensis TaxID=195088 RepID=A0A024P9C7_9BACI|nr:LLM class flavin-dependent oxidoreductase [Halobacillus karajensis]CDQ21524.1 Limonene 1,2-monooxygenase [Halobacillus karajensis]CDQ25458.1 Limonene 1,2-monooxygenase [Halobacillus karajensis]CDQ29011.1 Limonene 1,2-monooxygenase [Halobacillus karajensis]SEI09282.1 luciferase family oxidoreductase, group 1 [Halobacillus karajensis]
MKLSVLDQSPILAGTDPSEALKQTTELAKWTDKLGYHRFWVSEHHSTNSLAGSAPEILAAHLAAHTHNIRIGTGGVLLPHYSSYKVSETFRILETLHPNRIDLGVGRAPGGMPNVNLALNRGKVPSVEHYPSQVEELLAYLHGQDPQGMDIYATPQGETAPPVWMLGSSGTSARLAADLGVSYSFAHFINGRGGVRAMDRYQGYFTPSIQQNSPQGNVSVFVICAETDEHAEYLASSLDLALLQIEQGGKRMSFPTPEEALSHSYSLYEEERIQDNRNRMIVGSKNKVKEEIEQLADSYNVDEVIINTIVNPFEDRLRSYELLAEAFQLNHTTTTMM